MAQPLIERRQQFVGVDEQYAAVRPSFDHCRQVLGLRARQSAQRGRYACRRRLDVAAVDAYHRATGLVGDARELLEQRGFSDAAGAADVQHHEGRFVGQQCRAEDLDLRFTTDETASPRRGQPVGDAPVRGAAFATLGICGLGKWQHDRTPIHTRFLRHGGLGVLRRRHDEMPADVSGRRNQPVPSLRDRLDVLWVPLVVVERTTQVGDRSGQRRLRDESTLPYGVDYLVSRDDAAAGGRQEDERDPSPAVRDVVR